MRRGGLGGGGEKWFQESRHCEDLEHMGEYTWLYVEGAQIFEVVISVQCGWECG